MSTNNPVIVLIFLIYSLVLCWGNVSNSNVTMKFEQLHYFSRQNVGGDKRYYVPPVQKLGGICPPHKLGPCLAPLLFRIYISDLPTTVSRKYAYAVDLAIMHADEDWHVVEGVLSKDMATVDEYLQTGKLKLRTTKTVRAVFHLNNKEAKRELKVNHNNETLPFCSEPKYLGVTLDRSLTYRRHLKSLRKKLTSRVALLRRLAGSGWGAETATMRIAT